MIADRAFWDSATTVQVADLYARAITEGDRESQIVIAAYIRLLFNKRQQAAIDKLVEQFTRGPGLRGKRSKNA